ncbi:MAG: hypothetical protein ACTMKV_01960 [Sphingomonas parapaucimobilis]
MNFQRRHAVGIGIFSLIALVAAFAGMACFIWALPHLYDQPSMAMVFGGSVSIALMGLGLFALPHAIDRVERLLDNH